MNTDGFCFYFFHDDFVDVLIVAVSFRLGRGVVVENGERGVWIVDFS